MRKQDLRERLPDLLNGKLSPQEEEELLAELEKSGITREEIESIRSVSRMIDETPVTGPSEKMDKRFYDMLDEEQQKVFIHRQEVNPKSSLSSYLLTPWASIAAGIALFILGWLSSGWFGSKTAATGRQITELSVEVKQLKETLILTMMEERSPAERIRAVSMLGDFDEADNQIIEGLVRLLNNDSNNNVRLLALDALIRFSSAPEVREGLVASISNQTSPLVQLRLAEIMLALNEKSAVPEFQKVLQNANLNYRVRDKLNNAVGVLL